MRFLLPFFLVATALLFSGCTYLHSSAGNVVDVSSTDFSKLSKLKTARACRENILFLFGWGDKNLAAAIRNNKIKKIKYIENEDTIYFLYNKHCLVVYGR